MILHKMSTMDPHVDVFIGLGSNLGDRHAQIIRAFDWLARHPSIVLKGCSKRVETEPWGVCDQPGFVNAVAVIRTVLSPHELLILLKNAERELGRVRRHRRWGPREIDLDILLFGDLIIESENLTVPHRELANRPFILHQIVELNGQAFHPRLHTSIRELLNRLSP